MKTFPVMYKNYCKTCKKKCLFQERILDFNKQIKKGKIYILVIKCIKLYFFTICSNTAISNPTKV